MPAVPPLFPRGPRLLPRLMAGLLAGAVCLAPRAVSGQGAEAPTPAAMFARAQEKEQRARSASPTSVADLRAAATAYELLFREYPTNGYADNAVWQAAHLWATAYDRSGDVKDLQRAERWLTWLRQEYPVSPFASKVDAELAALPRPIAPPATTAATREPAGTATAAAARSTDTSAPASIRSITTTPLPQGQRVAIELSREVRFSGDRIGDPERVFFDFTDTSISSAVIESAKAAAGQLVRSIRFGHPTAGTTRVVLDLDGHPRYSTLSALEPFRLLIDVVDDTRASTPSSSVVAKSSADTARKATAPSASERSTKPPAASAPVPSKPAASNSAPPVSPPPASTTGEGQYTLGRQLGLGVSRIVIDAGHGGHDPGAMANGLTEADLVLDVALRLQKLLTATGAFDVVLTRDSDTYIPLEERTAIAKREDADLFLSIHANASRDTAARGVETYFLNIATDPAAEAVAARENALSGQTMGKVPQLVKAITTNNKLQESRELATFVQSSLLRGMGRQNKAIRDLGVKQAPFVVLIGADMPSVLAEISFITNKNEASLLKQSGFRDRIAQALCDAILKYQTSLKQVTSLAARDGGR
jgi:N-acetylmuramoyl-L-alanine amidase